jgi:hypothetical protein
MTSLEQIRAGFGEGGAGLVLIGMPGIEKRRPASRSSTLALASSMGTGCVDSSIGEITQDIVPCRRYPFPAGPERSRRVNDYTVVVRNSEYTKSHHSAHKNITICHLAFSAKARWNLSLPLISGNEGLFTPERIRPMNNYQYDGAGLALT